LEWRRIQEPALPFFNRTALFLAPNYYTYVLASEPNMVIDRLNYVLLGLSLDCKKVRNGHLLGVSFLLLYADDVDANCKAGTV
jgi:hypothetical protein